MKIAVTYDNGSVFQHFGRTEQFKVYDVENGIVVSSEVIDCNGVGHEALAWLLKDRDIDALICGGMGQGAQDALAEAGIEVCAGAEGNTDEAVAAYLAGELVNTGVNCDHHHEGHEHEHDHGEGQGCSPEGCSGCSGCGSPVYYFEGTNVGKTVRVHYRGTFDNGEQFDASYDRNEPLEFVCGAGMMIPGFDRAVAEMKVGDKIDIHLMPEEAYGMPREEMFLTARIAELPGAEELSVGDQVYLSDQFGRPIKAVVTAVEDGNITFDANHEMAGKELNFSIEMMEIL